MKRKKSNVKKFDKSVVSNNHDLPKIKSQIKKHYQKHTYNLQFCQDSKQNKKPVKNELKNNKKQKKGIVADFQNILKQNSSQKITKALPLKKPNQETLFVNKQPLKLQTIKGKKVSQSTFKEQENLQIEKKPCQSHIDQCLNLIENLKKQQKTDKNTKSDNLQNEYRKLMKNYSFLQNLKSYSMHQQNHKLNNRSLSKLQNKSLNNSVYEDESIANINFHSNYQNSCHYLQNNTKIFYKPYLKGQMKNNGFILKKGKKNSYY